jgi:hypothetical protein
LLFCNRVEDMLYSKGTRANSKFVYLRYAGNGSQRDGIGWPTKRIAGSTSVSERWSGVGGAGERRCEPDLWARASGTTVQR